MVEFVLSGPRGDNPLGLLACLGALAVLEDNGCCAFLGWDGVTPRLSADLGRRGASASTENACREALISTLHRALRRERSKGAAETERARKEMERCATALKKKREEVKRRGLKRDERAREIAPLEAQLSEKAAAFRRALAQSAADPAVTLGKNLTATGAELADFIANASEQCTPAGRRWVDLAAAYGVADPAEPGARMKASPWALIRGDSRQNFLASVEELMLRCTEAHIDQALFGPWEPRDEKYSLRLDSAEDRRYALMAGDPTASGNAPRSLWGANRLAFEALRFFPAMPDPAGMAVLAWRAEGGRWQGVCRARWPLWRPYIGAAVVRSLFGLRELWLDDPETRARLRSRGVHAVMETRRIQVEKKYTLTPPVPVWASAGAE